MIEIVIGYCYKKIHTIAVYFVEWMQLSTVLFVAKAICKKLKKPHEINEYHLLDWYNHLVIWCGIAMHDAIDGGDDMYNCIFCYKSMFWSWTMSIYNCYIENMTF